MLSLPRFGIAALCVALVAAGGTALAADGGTSSQSDADLAWTVCQQDYQCSSLSVPVDYRHPAGAKMSLSVIRRPAADTAHRLGVLLLQPGGPGNSGVGFVQSTYETLAPQVRDRFDLVGFDPRGVAASGQLQCWDDARYAAAFLEASAYPAAKHRYGSAVKAARDFRQSCSVYSGTLLNNVGTGYVARDIDALRAALGERQLSFFGRSFGTYVGTVYASTYPARVRAMVLDGAYDPYAYAKNPYRYDAGQYAALDTSARHFLSWCAANQGAAADGRCGWSGASPAALKKLLERLDAEPVAMSNGSLADGFTAAFRMILALNDGKAGWPALGEALRLAQAGDKFSDLLTPPTAASIDFLTTNVVVECNDRTYPRSTTRLRNKLETRAKGSPIFGPAMAYGPPTYDHNHAAACVAGRYEHHSAYRGSYKATGSAPILVIGTTGDPDTPYRDTVRLSKTLANARLLTFQAEGHAAYGRSTCTADAVTSYLVERTLPASGTVCSDEAPPAPVAPGARMSAALI